VKLFNVVDHDTGARVVLWITRLPAVRYLVLLLLAERGKRGVVP
jgi:hypothetical protein